MNCTSERRGMSDPIPPRLWSRLQKFLADVRAGEWSGGGQIVLNVSPEGEVTSLEAKGRDDNRPGCATVGATGQPTRTT